MANKDAIFAMATEGGRIESMFWRYGPRPIKINRKRKRAIERAKHLTRMATIEGGDTVEIVSLNSTDLYFGLVDDMKRVGDKFKVGGIGYGDENQIIDNEPLWYSYHRQDLKLIEKGTKQWQ